MSVDSQLSDISGAVDELAKVVMSMDTGDTWLSWSCREIEVLAELLDVNGNTEAMEFVREQHAMGDEEGDQHWTLGQETLSSHRAEWASFVMGDGNRQVLLAEADRRLQERRAQRG